MADDKSNSDEGKKQDAEVPEIIKLVNSNDVSGVERLLITGAASVHDTDATGMTALMHAAYKGYTDMATVLIKQGSDVNADCHSHSYSPLHFAALSSSLDTVQLLLDAGAKTYKTNTLGRTAAQMAGFVGHSSAVALINNHVDRSDLHKYTRPTSDLQKTRLDPSVEDELYDIIMEVNLSPVQLSLKIGRSMKLVRHLKEASQVLHHMSVAETKRSSNVNEVLSLKFHYLSYLLNRLSEEYEKNFKDETPTQTDAEGTERAVPYFEPFLKQLLKCRSSDGCEVWQELWLRDAIKAFHCAEMPLFLQVVRSLTGPDMVALTVLTSAINGQRLPDEVGVQCVACTRTDANNKTCSRCKAVKYCTRYCQKIHWFSHKKFCKDQQENKEN